MQLYIRQHSKYMIHISSYKMCNMKADSLNIMLRYATIMTVLRLSDPQNKAY